MTELFVPKVDPDRIESPPSYIIYLLNRVTDEEGPALAPYIHIRLVPLVVLLLDGEDWVRVAPPFLANS